MGYPAFIYYLLSNIFYLLSFLEGFAVFVVGVLVEDAHVADEACIGDIAVLDGSQDGATGLMGVGAVVETAI